MPLYEYRCDACDRQFEVIRKFSDPPLETCPTCGGPIQKLASSPAIQFKGTGWYITDYAKKDHAPAGKSGDAQADSGDKTRADKGEKGEKAATTEKADKSDKGSATPSASTSAAPATSTSTPGKDA